LIYIILIYLKIFNIVIEKLLSLKDDYCSVSNKRFSLIKHIRIENNKGVL